MATKIKVIFEGANADRKAAVLSADSLVAGTYLMKVGSDKSVELTAFPALPTAAGNYKLVISAEGVASWAAIV